MKVALEAFEYERIHVAVKGYSSRVFNCSHVHLHRRPKLVPDTKYAGTLLLILYSPVLFLFCFFFVIYTT